MPSWHENDGVHSFACYYNKPQSKITTFETKTYFERHILTILIVSGALKLVNLVKIYPNRLNLAYLNLTIPAPSSP